MGTYYRVYFEVDVEAEVIGRIKFDELAAELADADEVDKKEYSTLYTWYERKGYGNGVLDEFMESMDEDCDTEDCPFAFAKENLSDCTDVYFRGNDQGYSVGCGIWSGKTKWFSKEAKDALDQLLELHAETELVKTIRKGMY